MLKEKIRVYALARELDIDSKDLLDLCRQRGMDVKNQLSSLDPEQRDEIVALIKKGVKGTAVAAPAAAPAPVLPTNLDNRVRVIAPAVRKKEKEEGVVEPVVAPVEAPPAAILEPEPPPPVVAKAPAPPTDEPPLPPPVVSQPPQPAPVKVAEPAPTRRLPDMPSKPTALPGSRVPSLSPNRAPASSPTAPPVAQQPATASSKPTAQPRPPAQRPIRRMMVSRLAQPPALKAQKKEDKVPVQQPIARPDAFRTGNLSPQQAVQEAMKMAAAPVAPVEGVDEEDDDKKGGKKPGGVVGRDQRHRKRNERAAQRRDRQGVEVRGSRVVLPIDDDRPLPSHKRAKIKLRPITEKRKGKVPIEFPITVRSLSQAIGVPVGDLLLRLRNHGAPPTIMINSALDQVLAETVALEAGCELDVKRALGAEEQLLAELDQPNDEDGNLVPRAPIVAVMGHVDHGKTSLLDRIRKSDIAATEVGGITQVIRAWRVDHGGRPVTFLDTPGHEAFTKMRARGAQVTDIAVIVCAADDGVMPQTEEAINHARAAEVPMVIAINKVDLPNANLIKTRQQLYSMGLLPDDMGGDIPFVETSAATGKGIDELLDKISIVSEILLELKANPDRPAHGTCLEAMLSEGEGVFATLLVQDGTLRKGDPVVCGASYGRVRAMYDDMGRPIQEAGPSVPVRITGLDVIPNADDLFHVVPDLAVAREIAEKRRAAQLDATLTQRKPLTLEDLGQVKIAELKLILKADFRGSIEAIKKELEKLHHEEVRVNLLHAAIGGITESDVQLALTAPENTIIVGFNVVPDDRARVLAEDRGVQIREYDIIYNLTNDIRQALEGKLKPHEQVVHLGRAVVREVFKISRVGTVAGCYVTQGTIERAAKVRIIRSGIVVYPPADRTASLDSLKRFKEDVKEVREGFECGMKIAGYDDLKVDDVIEAYRVEQVQRTL